MSLGLTKYKIANLVGFIITVVVNSAANILPFNGVTTGEISDKYANLLTPAGYVFSIWSVIYTLLTAFIIFQLFSDDEELHKNIGWGFVISCFFNSIWMFLWHYELIVLSVVVMFGLLVSLIMIYLRLEVGLVDLSRKEFILTHVPFSVYLGWITVASIANVTTLLVSIGWPVFNSTATYLTAVIILITLILTVINTYIRGDIGYAAVIIWALGGIIQKQINNWLIPWVAGLSIIIILIFLFYRKLVTKNIRNQFNHRRD